MTGERSIPRLKKWTRVSATSARLSRRTERQTTPSRQRFRPPCRLH
jgi:hypothetical protein